MSIQATDVVSAKKIVQLEAECDRLKEERIRLKGEVMEAKAKEKLMKDKYLKVKAKHENVKEMFESERSKWREEEEVIRDKCWKAELEKTKLEMDLRAAWRRTEDEAEAEALKCLLEEKDCTIRSLLGGNEAMEAAKVEMEDKISELLEKIEALVKEKGDKEAEICQLMMEKSIKAERIEESEKREIMEEHKKKVLELNRCIEVTKMEKNEGIKRIFDQMEALKEKREKEISELVSRVDELEREKLDKTDEMKRILSEIAALKDECDSKILKFVSRVNILEREKMEALKESNDKIEEIKRISYDESEKVASEQALRIEVLEAAVSQAKREKIEEIEIMLKEKAALKDKLEKKNLDLDLRVDVLEREKKEVEEEACEGMRAVLKEKHDKIEEMKRILNENAALKEEYDKKILKFVSRVHVLETEKKEMETEACQAKRAGLKEKQDMTMEIKRVLNGKVALKEECDKKITKFVSKMHILEREKKEAEAEACQAKMVALNEKVELEEKILELHGKIEVFEKDEEVKDDEIRKLKMDKSVEAERFVDVNHALEAEKRRMEEAKETINDLAERVVMLEVVKEAGEYEKREMEDEHRKKVLELTNTIEVFEGEKNKLIEAIRDNREEIKRILCEKMAVEAEKRAEKDGSEKKVSELARRIEVLEWENREMEAEISQAKREKMEEIERIYNEMEALKENHEKKNLKLVSRVGDLETEMKKMEAEANQAKSADLKEKCDKTDEVKRILSEKAALKEECEGKISKFASRVHILEREKKEAEAEACQAKMAALKEKHDKIEKMKTNLNEKAALKEECEGKISKLASRVYILEREKKEAEAEACQAKMALKEKHDKIEKMKMNLKEKVALKEQYDKKILAFFSRVEVLERDMEAEKAEKATLKEKNFELVSRVEVLETQKQGLEAETRKKDGAIKVLAQKNKCLATEKEIMKKETNRHTVLKLEDDVESPQREHPVSIVGLLVTPTTQNQGRKPVDVSVREMQRRKVEALGCSVANQVRTKRSKS